MALRATVPCCLQTQGDATESVTQDHIIIIFLAVIGAGDISFNRKQGFWTATMKMFLLDELP